MTCDLCGGCVAVCPLNAITITSTQRLIDENLCTNCGICIQICPVSKSQNLPLVEKLYSSHPNLLPQGENEIKFKVLGSGEKFLGEYDLIVIGAGPAGIVTSLYAGARGAKVLLVDRKQAIGLPLRCAEGLLEYSFTMAGMSLDNIPFNWLKSRFCGVLVVKGGQKEIIPSKGFLVDRTKMEQDMIGDAQKYGVKLRLNTSLRKIEKDIVFFDNGFAKTNVIVGADGVDSGTGRQTGLLKPLKAKNIASCF